MSLSALIEEALQEAFAPVHLDVVNESHLHRGHAGDDGSGDSHFRITVVSSLFAGKSRVECHRMIWDVLDKALPVRPHALSIKAYPPKVQPE